MNCLRGQGKLGGAWAWSWQWREQYSRACVRAVVLYSTWCWMHGVQGQRQGLARTDFTIRLPPSGEVCLACQHTSMVQVSSLSVIAYFWDHSRLRYLRVLIAITRREILPRERRLSLCVALRINSPISRPRCRHCVGREMDDTTALTWLQPPLISYHCNFAYVAIFIVFCLWNLFFIWLFLLLYLFIAIIKIKGFYRLVSVDIVRRWIYEIDIYILFVK